MLFKYYTAELIMLNGEKLEVPSITIKTWRWRNPVQVITMMKNDLDICGFTDHRIINLRRIK